MWRTCPTGAWCLPETIKIPKTYQRLALQRASRISMQKKSKCYTVGAGNPPLGSSLPTGAAAPLAPPLGELAAISRLRG